MWNVKFSWAHTLYHMNFSTVIWFCFHTIEALKNQWKCNGKTFMNCAKTAVQWYPWLWACNEQPAKCIPHKASDPQSFKVVRFLGGRGGYIYDACGACASSRLELHASVHRNSRAEDDHAHERYVPRFQCCLGMTRLTTRAHAHACITCTCTSTVWLVYVSSNHLLLAILDLRITTKFDQPATHNTCMTGALNRIYATSPPNYVVNVRSQPAIYSPRGCLHFQCTWTYTCI